MKTFFYSFAAMMLMASCGSHDPTENQKQAEGARSAAETTVNFTESQLRNAGITVGTPQEESIGQTLTLQGADRPAAAEQRKPQLSTG